jgi:CRP-like cAMP-binding protein
MGQAVLSLPVGSRHAKRGATGETMENRGSDQSNLLLRALPSGVLKQSNPREEFHPLRHVLFGSEKTPDSVYFPHVGAVASIVRSTASGQMIETGVIGAEGLVNVQTVLANISPSQNQAIVQNEGTFTAIEIERVRYLMEAHPPFRQALLDFVSLFLDQVTQHLVCNRLHPIEQRLSKWLLLMRDRVVSDELHLTQEFISYMLGVHRPGVSIAVSTLENDGLIRHRRNRIAIIDRDGLIARSCECFQPVHSRLKEFTKSFQ